MQGMGMYGVIGVLGLLLDRFITLVQSGVKKVSRIHF